MYCTGKCCILTKTANFGSPYLFFSQLTNKYWWGLVGIHSAKFHTHTPSLYNILTLWQCWTAQANSRNTSFAAVSDRPSLSST